MHPEVPTQLAQVLVSDPVPQRAFRWVPEGWNKACHERPEILDRLAQLPERVDRGTVREAVLSDVGDGHVLSAFVSAMIWGFGDAGYGPARVRWILTGIRGSEAYGAPIRTDVEGLLGSAIDVVRSEGAIEGFRYMNNAGRIKHLGSAFFTKWLYFTSATEGPDDPRAAAILDKQVGDWLRDNAGVTLDIRRTPEYQRYIEILGTWGKMYSRAPVQVEKAIFGLATGRT